MTQKKCPTIPQILSQFVLNARNSKEERRPSAFSNDQWWIEIMEGVTVGFDGYSFDDNNKENPDDESYLVTISIDDDSQVSFVVALEDCLSGTPLIDEEYVETMYERDVIDQLERAETRYDREKFERLVRKLYQKLGE